MVGGFLRHSNLTESPDFEQKGQLSKIWHLIFRLLAYSFYLKINFWHKVKGRFSRKKSRFPEE